MVSLHTATFPARNKPARPVPPLVATASRPRAGVPYLAHLPGPGPPGPGSPPPSSPSASWSGCLNALLRIPNTALFAAQPTMATKFQPRSLLCAAVLLSVAHHGASQTAYCPALSTPEDPADDVCCTGCAFNTVQDQQSSGPCIYTGLGICLDYLQDGTCDYPGNTVSSCADTSAPTSAPTPAPARTILDVSAPPTPAPTLLPTTLPSAGNVFGPHADCDEVVPNFCATGSGPCVHTQTLTCLGFIPGTTRCYTSLDKCAEVAGGPVESTSPPSAAPTSSSPTADDTPQCTGCRFGSDGTCRVDDGDSAGACFTPNGGDPTDCPTGTSFCGNAGQCSGCAHDTAGTCFHAPSSFCMDYIQGTSQCYTTLVDCGADSVPASSTAAPEPIFQCEGCMAGTTGPCKHAPSGYCLAFIQDSTQCLPTTDRCTLAPSAAPTTLAPSSSPTASTASPTATMSPTSTPSSSTPTQSPTPAPTLSPTEDPNPCGCTISESFTLATIIQFGAESFPCIGDEGTCAPYDPNSDGIERCALGFELCAPFDSTVTSTASSTATSTATTAQKGRFEAECSFGEIPVLVAADAARCQENAAALSAVVSGCGLAETTFNCAEPASGFHVLTVSPVDDCDQAAIRLNNVLNSHRLPQGGLESALLSCDYDTTNTSLRRISAAGTTSCAETAGFLNAGITDFFDGTFSECAMTSESTTASSTASSTAVTGTLGQFACHHDSDVSESFMVQEGGTGTCEAQVRHLGDLLESCAPGVVTTSLLCDADLRVRQGVTCNAVANTLQSALRKYVRHAALALATYGPVIDAIRCTSDGEVSGFLSTSDHDTCTSATDLMNMMLGADTAGDFVDCTVVASSTPTTMPTAGPTTPEPTPAPTTTPSTPGPTTSPTPAPTDFGAASFADTCYAVSPSVRYLQFNASESGATRACATGELMAGFNRVAGFCGKTLALECNEELTINGNILFLAATNGPANCVAAAGDLSDMLNTFTGGMVATSLLSCDGTGKIRLDTADCDTVQGLANQMITSAARGEFATCEFVTSSTTQSPTLAPTPAPTQAVAKFECTALGPKAYLAASLDGVGVCGDQVAMMRSVLDECQNLGDVTPALSCSATNLVQAGPDDCGGVADIITLTADFFQQQEANRSTVGSDPVGLAVCTVGGNIEFTTLAECDGTAYQLNRMVEAFVAGTFGGCTDVYSASPSGMPSMGPSSSEPTPSPTQAPSLAPTGDPTMAPTVSAPTVAPSRPPTRMPTRTQGQFSCLNLAGEQYLSLPDPITCADHAANLVSMVEQCLTLADAFSCTSPGLAPEATVLRAGVSYGNCRAVVGHVSQLMHDYSRGNVLVALDCTRTGMVYVPNGQCGLVTTTLNAAYAEIVPIMADDDVVDDASSIDCQTYVITESPTMAPIPSPTAAPIQLLALGCDTASRNQPNDSYVTFNGPTGVAGCQTKIGMLERLMDACMFAGTTQPQPICVEVGTGAEAVIHVAGGQNCASVVSGLQAILEARSPDGAVQLSCDADGFLLTANDPCSNSGTSTAVDTLNQALTYFADADYANCEFTTLSPTARPTAIPTHEPTGAPSAIPSQEPTAMPSAIPTMTPTFTPCDTFECADECGWDTDTNTRDTSSPCGWNHIDLACQEGQVTTTREVVQAQCVPTTVTSTATSTVTTSFDGPACEARAGRDVVFAVDGSSFVPFEPVYDLYMDWILDIIQSLPVGSGEFRFGLMVMSASNSVVFGLDNGYTDQASYRDDIQAAISSFPNDATSASAAMAVVEGMFGATPDSRGKTLVLVTGGLLGGEVAAGNGASLVNSVNELAANDIEVIPVATGRAEYNLAVELSRPSSAAPIGIYEYHPATAFEADDDLDVLGEILLDVSGAIGCDNYKYVKTHEGRTASNVGSALRFSTGFRAEFYTAGAFFTGVTFSDVLPPCAVACDASPTCLGFFVYVDFGATGIQNNCVGLDDLGTAAGPLPTNTVSYSYSKTPSN